jgi:hypothetical protein
MVMKMMVEAMIVICDDDDKISVQAAFQRPAGLESRHNTAAGLG